MFVTWQGGGGEIVHSPVGLISVALSTVGWALLIAAVLKRTTDIGR